MGSFNIRVYGCMLHNGRVLVADELIKGHRITKFPGGGLEFGEGPKHCLIREVREEIGVEAFNVEHFYTTDFSKRARSGRGSRSSASTTRSRWPIRWRYR